MTYSLRSALMVRDLGNHVNHCTTSSR